MAKKDVVCFDDIQYDTNKGSCHFASFLQEGVKCLGTFLCNGQRRTRKNSLAFFIGSMLKSLQSRIISHAVAQAMHS